MPESFCSVPLGSDDAPTGETSNESAPTSDRDRRPKRMPSNGSGISSNDILSNESSGSLTALAIPSNHASGLTRNGSQRSPTSGNPLSPVGNFSSHKKSQSMQLGATQASVRRDSLEGKISDLLTVDHLSSGAVGRMVSRLDVIARPADKHASSLNLNGVPDVISEQEASSPVRQRFHTQDIQIARSDGFDFAERQRTWSLQAQHMYSGPAAVSYAHPGLFKAIASPTSSTSSSEGKNKLAICLTASRASLKRAPSYPINEPTRLTPQRMLKRQRKR